MINTSKSKGLKYLGVLFMREGKTEPEVDKRINVAMR